MMAHLGRSAIIIGLSYRAGCGAERVWPLTAASRQPSSIVLVLVLVVVLVLGFCSIWSVGAR